MKLKRPLRGSERGADVSMVQRALNKAPSQTVILVDGIYGETTKRRMRSFRAAWSLSAGDHLDQRALDALWPYFDAYGRFRYRLFQPPPIIPDLGPVVQGGVSLLKLRMTHPTSGIPHYPALDAGWVVNLDALAVEDMRVSQASSANVGDACYTRGASGAGYWYGHLIWCPPVGTWLRKGAKVGDIAVHPNGAHVHFGMDARPLIDRDLVFGYGPEVPTVGEQLQRYMQPGV